MLVLVVCLCPSSVHVVATFSGTALFPLLCSVLPFFLPNTIGMWCLAKLGHLNITVGFTYRDRWFRKLMLFRIYWMIV